MHLKKKSTNQSGRKEMNFAMRISFVVGVLMLILKTYTYFITGSAAILSDAAESVIHILAIGFAAYSMWLSFKPADSDHLYGHDKIAFFSAGFEGAMIIVAAIYIFYESIYKILFGFQIENTNIGMLFLIFVIIINFLVSIYLIRKGKKHKSLILEADGKHILTDCWTSVGALVALILVKFTGILLFDPIIAILIGINILWTGAKLIKRSISGLMDQTDLVLHQKIISILRKETIPRNLEFHHLKDRMSGNKVFIEFHLLFSQNVDLQKAHDIASDIEAKLKSALDMDAEIITHLEPKKHHDNTHHKYGLPV